MKADTLFDMLDSNLFRPVVEGPVNAVSPITGELISVNDKKALMYDNGELISIVGHKYRVIQNEEVYYPFCEAIVGSDLDLTDMKINTSFGANGRSLTSFIFPSHFTEVKKGDITQLRIVARNSHDGTWKFSVDTGGFRLACANGQVVGKFNNAYSNRHSVNFNVESMSNLLSHQIEGFSTLGEWWLNLSKISLDFDKGTDAISLYLYGKVKPEEDKKKMLESEKATVFNAITDKYEEYMQEMGKNAYALYNALTDHATHSSPKPEHQFDRQKRIINVMDTLVN